MLRSLLLSFLLAGVALAAPAPPIRAPKPLPPCPFPWVGSWRMHWKGGVHSVTFARDGSYQCAGDWAGTWCLDDKTHILYVEELSQSGSVLRWSVTMQGPTSGILDDGTEWRLEPRDS